MTHLAPPRPERRDQLKQADELLETLEQLQLAGRRQLPPALGAAILTVAEEITRTTLSWPAPATVAAAHRLVLALEAPLLRSLAGTSLAPGQKSARRPAKRVPRVSLPAIPAEPQPGWDWDEQVRWHLQRAYEAVQLYKTQAKAAQGVGEMELAEAREEQAQLMRTRLGELHRAARAVGISYQPEAPLLPAAGVLNHRGFYLSSDRRTLRGAGLNVRLTPHQGGYLALLIANAPHPVSREALTQYVMPDNPQAEITARTIDVQLSSLRRRIAGAFSIIGIEGGYRLP